MCCDELLKVAMIQVEYKITIPVWYAMKASYGKSVKAKEVLDSMSIDNYIPMCHKEVIINRRKRIVEVPVISGLIFIKADLQQLESAKRNIQFLHNMLTKNPESSEILNPIIVPEREMNQFMNIVKSQSSVKYVDTEVNPLVKGSRVRIIAGEFEGYEGVLMKIKGARSRKVIVNISGIVAIELDAIDAEMIEEIKN